MNTVSYNYIQEDIQLYGVDWSGPILINDEDEVDSVEVPPITTVQLTALVSPLHVSDNYGLDLFLTAQDFVEPRAQV